MSRPGARSRNESAGQKWALVGIACLLVLLSVGSTLYVTGIPAALWGSRDAEEARYRHTTLTDAEAVCTAHAREVFGRRLTNLRVDRFSSRLDRGDNQYKVFMEADIYPSRTREGVALETLINCFTATDSTDIELFQYAKDGTQFIAPGEEEKGMFGL
jgi:hypothetical protein